MLNSDWLSDSIMNGDWLYSSHVKNAIRKPDWTYRFFHPGENVAHTEFCLQGLLPKILAIYTIKRYLCWGRKKGHVALYLECITHHVVSFHVLLLINFT